jgi:serine-type D-Ala-D-Ala carboxypeptidase (penicillin-binding protein 5/6)
MGDLSISSLRSIVRSLTRSGAAAIFAASAILATQLTGLLQAAPAGAAARQPAASPGAASPGTTSPGTTSPGAVSQAGPAGIVAAAADLVDLTTGHRLWSRGLDKGRPIASIAKIMTALVVIRAGDLNREIKVTASEVSYARKHDAGTAGLVAGDVLTARQLLEGMLLPSGADAAFALAQTYGPGWRGFVKKMNATAKVLGMTHTHFANFDGLPWPTEHSTYASPRALLILAKAAMGTPTLATIVGQRQHFIGATSAHHRYSWKNTNLLLASYSGALGIKTGFTNGAGNCLLFAARRGGQLLIGVVLGTAPTKPSVRFTAATTMLNWGFSHAH